MDRLGRALATIGTVFVLVPLLAPVLLALVRLLATGHLGLDFLMPLELFPMVLIGAGLLVWVALRSHRQRAVVLTGLGSSLVLLVVGSWLAEATGLASGAHDAEGWRLALVAGCFAGSLLGIVALAAGGVLLVRDLSRGTFSPAPRARARSRPRGRSTTR